MELLSTVSGIGWLTALTLIVEIVDFGRFRDGEALSSFTRHRKIDPVDLQTLPCTQPGKGDFGDDRIAGKAKRRDDLDRLTFSTG